MLLSFTGVKAAAGHIAGYKIVSKTMNKQEWSLVLLKGTGGILLIQAEAGENPGENISRPNKGPGRNVHHIRKNLGDDLLW